MFESITQYFISTHPYIQALLIIVAALFVALIVLPFVAGIIKILTRKTDTEIDDKLIAALNAPIFYLAIIFGMSIAFPLLGLPSGILSVLQMLLQTLMVIVIAQSLLRIIRIVLEGAVNKERPQAINSQTLPLFVNISFVIVIAAALYGIFLIWGIDVTAWLASAGIVGIAVGFAAKDTLSNIISGIFILADKPYSIGDYVVLGSGIKGIVTNVGLRSTRIRTFDDEEVTVPNASIANEAITNKTTGPRTSRVKIDIGVAYGTDVQKVEELLLDIANAHKLILKDPAAIVRFVNFGESSLDFSLSCRVDDPLDVYATQSELRYAINNRFAEEGIEIPFPQRDIHMKK